VPVFYEQTLSGKGKKLNKLAKGAVLVHFRFARARERKRGTEVSLCSIFMMAD
jgi:hypothetical protein